MASARAATEAIAASLTTPASRQALACSAATAVAPGHNGATTYGSSWVVRIWSIGPAVVLPLANTTAVSHSPVCSLIHASYSASAPSPSTCDSTIGGQAPMASTADTKLNGWPLM